MAGTAWDQIGLRPLELARLIDAAAAVLAAAPRAEIEKKPAPAPTKKHWRAKPRAPRWAANAAKRKAKRKAQRQARAITRRAGR